MAQSLPAPSILDYVDAHSSMRSLLSEIAFGSGDPKECVGPAERAMDTVAHYQRRHRNDRTVRGRHRL